MVEDADDDDGAAIFRPYTPGEESTIDVPDASKRLFTIILAVPTLALLLGILTYNPTNDELAQEQERKAEQLRRCFALWSAVRKRRNSAAHPDAFPRMREAASAVLGTHLSPPSSGWT